MINFIDALMHYGFLQKALTTSIMVGIICGVIGCFIILRGMALMGDAISHAVLPGVALSYMLGINFFFGAVFTGVLTSLGIGFISQNSRIKNDVSIGIMFTAAFASGIIMITLMKSSTDLYHILFGNVLAVRPSEMWSTLLIGVIVLSMHLCLLQRTARQFVRFNYGCGIWVTNKSDSLFLNDTFDIGNSCFPPNSWDCACCSNAHHSSRDCILVDKSSLGYALPFGRYRSVIVHIRIVFQLYLQFSIRCRNSTCSHSTIYSCICIFTQTRLGVACY